jgi:hypothetical protein
VKKLTINIELENDAFRRPDELSSILRQLAETLQTTFPYDCKSFVAGVFNTNGNRVGYVKISDTESKT